MLLQQLYTNDAETAMSILVSGQLVKAIAEPGKIHPASGDFELSFENAIAFPGLINSHDHLDFNLFPRMGNKIYHNYVEWGNDIHRNNKQQIDAILKIPQQLRTSWGIYRNLLNGFTTVVNHGAKLATENAPIGVFQQCYNLHSVRLEKFWKLKLNKVLRHPWPIVIHAGEGTDAASAEEIDQLVKWNIRKRKLIAIHGVAMDNSQAKNFTGLVWCPATNLFLLGKTARVQHLQHHTTIVFGTDSTLTASWNAWDQLRQALQLKLITAQALYEAVTSQPAKLWDLPFTGTLQKNVVADIVIARKKRNTFYDAFFTVDPEDILLVLHKGKIKLFDESLLPQLKNTTPGLESFNRIQVQNSNKWVFGNIISIIKDIRQYCPQIELPVFPA